MHRNVTAVQLSVWPCRFRRFPNISEVHSSTQQANCGSAAERRCEGRQRTRGGPENWAVPLNSHESSRGARSWRFAWDLLSMWRQISSTCCTPSAPASARPERSFEVLSDRWGFRVYGLQRLEWSKPKLHLGTVSPRTELAMHRVSTPAPVFRRQHHCADLPFLSNICTPGLWPQEVHRAVLSCRSVKAGEAQSYWVVSKNSNNNNSNSTNHINIYVKNCSWSLAGQASFRLPSAEVKRKVGVCGLDISCGLARHWK